MRAEPSEFLNTGMHGNCASCGWGNNHSENYKALYEKYRALKALKIPISGMIKVMEAVSCEDMARKYVSRHHSHEPPAHYETVAAKVQALKNRLCICLDYVRGGDVATPCRFQHE